MKIALVAQNATPLHPRAGSGPDRDDIGLGELTRKLASQGHQVTVYTEKNLPDLPEQAQLHDGVQVKYIDAGPAGDEPGDADLLRRVPAFSGPLRSHWQSDRPDIVHALRWTSGLAALAAARDLGIPVVQEFNSLCVTERRAAARLLDSPGAVKADAASAARIRLASDDNYVKLAKFAATLGITDRVIFTGHVEYADLPALLRSANLVVSTCQYDPSGTSSLQAMACGTPVIAPPVGGHMDAVVDGTTGIIIQPDRPALLAQRIRQLLAHPMLIEAYGVAAADRVRSRYSWDRIAGETIAVYDRVMAQAA